MLISSPSIHIFIATFAVAMTATSVWAQETGGFVAAAFIASPWTVNSVSGGSPSTTYANATVESSVVGAGADVGWRVTRQRSLAVEIDIPSRRDLSQTFEYDFGPYQLESRYRDLTILGVLRQRLLLDARAHIELVGGFGINRGSSLQRVATLQFPSFSTFGPFGAEDEVTHTSIAATAGADFPIDAARHLSVVPQFRVLVLPHGSVRTGGNFASFGLNTMVYRFGVGLRVAF